MDDRLYEVHEKYHKLVYYICHRMISDKEKSQDASQEVWIEIIDSLDTFKNDLKLSTWIYTVANRTIKRFITEEKTYETKYLSDYFHGEDLKMPEEKDIDKDIWVREMCDSCITGMLHCLGNEARMIYLLKDVCELEYDEIAEIMDKKEATIRKIASRARNKLKKFLENECCLYNPDGKCRCRMKKWVDEINLSNEYKMIKQMRNRANFFKDSMDILPKKHYWDRFVTK